MSTILRATAQLCASRMRGAAARARAAAVARPEAALRIGTNVWIGSEPLYLARELGHLDPATVQLVEYPSASEVLRAFRNQAIDGMVISLDELFGLAVDGFQPRIILVVDVSHGADVVVGRRGMKTMHDLKGKSVAVESGALGAFVLSRALALNGMQASDVNVVHLESNEQPTRVREGPGRRRRHVRSVSRPVPARPARRPCSTARRFRARSSISSRCARTSSRSSPKAIQALLTGWFGAIDYMKSEPEGRGAAHGHSPADDRRAVPAGAARACTFRPARRTCGCSAARRRSWRSPDAGSWR